MAHATAAQPADLLAAARRGDEHAYRRLVEPHRRELHAHCYRMLGSLHDAEDALQDALLRAWRGLGGFDGRSSVRSWLYRIATNASLDVIQRRPKRMLPMDLVAASEGAVAPGGPLSDPTWIEPYPDEQIGLEDGFAGPEARYERREAVELALIAALQQLPATQRAVLILREVLGFSAAEVADSLDTTVPSVTSALQRARRSVEQRRPERTQQATLRALGDRRLRELVERYMDAMGRGDVDAIVAMLAEDAVWSMPPLSSWYAGRDAVTGFLVAGPLSGRWRWRHRAASANGQPAVGAYAWDEETAAFVPFALDVLTLRGEHIEAVTAFVTRSSEARSPDLFARWPDQPADRARIVSVFERFGLPDRLD